MHHPLHTPQLPRRGLHGYSWRKWRPLSNCYLVHSTTELQVLRSPAFRASSRLIRSLKHCSAESGAHIVDPITTLRTWTWSVLQHSTHPAAVDKSHPLLRSKPVSGTKSKALAISADLLGEKISLTSTRLASKQLQLQHVVYPNLPDVLVGDFEILQLGISALSHSSSSLSPSVVSSWVHSCCYPLSHLLWRSSIFSLGTASAAVSGSVRHGRASCFESGGSSTWSLLLSASAIRSAPPPVHLHA